MKQKIKFFEILKLSVMCHIPHIKQATKEREEWIFCIYTNHHESPQWQHLVFRKTIETSNFLVAGLTNIIHTACFTREASAVEKKSPLKWMVVLQGFRQ